MKKSVINDGLAQLFPNIRFEESEEHLDHAGDIDYIGYINNNVAFGIQIKPITAQGNFGNYSISDRMRASFDSFKEEFSGNVFIIFSVDGEIANTDVIDEIKGEIERLSSL